MHPDIGIVCMYRISEGIYTIPDDHNNLTFQSSNTNNSPRDPLHGPNIGGKIYSSANVHH